MKNKTLSLIVLVFIVGVIVVYARLKKQDSNKQPELIALTFAENKIQPFPKVIVIAQQKGFFRDQGLEVKTVSFTSGKEALNAMLANDAQIAEAAETPLVFLGFTDQSAQIFTNVTKGYNNKILARKDRGIDSPPDLKGKKIAAPKGTSAEFALNEFLRVNQLSMKDIEYINLTPLAMPNALAKGEIDAYAIWEPHINTGQKLFGNNAIVFPIETSIYENSFSYVAKRGWLNNNPETVKKFLQAVIQTEKYITEHPDESLKISADYMGLDEEILKTFKDDYKIKIRLEIKSLVTLMQRVGTWVNSQKPEAERKVLPDYRNQINDTFLKEVDPSRIQ